jgi:hypothetical protein
MMNATMLIGGEGDGTVVSLSGRHYVFGERTYRLGSIWSTAHGKEFYAYVLDGTAPLAIDVLSRLVERGLVPDLS